MHIGGVTGFLRSLALLVRTFKPTRCIIAFDGKGGSAKRKKMYSEYKENRAVRTKFNRYEEFEDIQDEQASMRMQFQRLIEYLDCLPISTIAIDNIEADDSIAYLTTQVFTESERVVIVSSDRDYLQLCNERVNVWSPIKKKLYTTELVLQEYGVNAKNFLLYRAVIGDTGDNISGVPGIGAKTLLKAFPQLSADAELSVDFLVENSKDQEKKVFQSIVTNESKIHLNYALMQLKEPDINGNAKLMLLDFAARPTNEYNIAQFKRMFMMDKMFTVIKDIDTWLRTSFGYLSAMPRE